jgi:Fur family transcriptional regulator, peroxide stress response regulator
MPDDVPNIAASLRAHGLRSTRARRLIIGVFAPRNDHPTVEEIARRLAEQDRPLSLPTLYQNLHRMVEAGLLQSFLDSEKRMRFDANLVPHHHLRCLGCGLILDVEPEEKLEEVIAQMSDSLGCFGNEWALEEARIELRGYCPSCRASGTGKA